MTVDGMNRRHGFSGSENSHISSKKVDGASSIRVKQGVFLIFFEDWIWAWKDLPGRELRFGRAGSRPRGMWASGTEDGDGCGWWQPPGADYFFKSALAPFAWRTGVTSSRQLAGAELLDAMVRPGNEYPRVGSGATGVLAY